jgi:molybdopterin synthase catalytic subunit
MRPGFLISEVPLDGFALREEVLDPSAGGFVSFEGWVRDHHEGRSVEHLEYEAYAALCLRAGEDLVAEAMAKFSLRKALAVHRTGRLGIGEMAVWVGVASDHRREAFQACEWLIDRIKHDLPIWKKETFVDGTSGWVNCERCSGHSAHA